MNILITNDDSHRSPLLQVVVDYFSRLGTVHLVVPLHEQSWTGKSMSRFSPVHAQAEKLCGLDALSVSGTPADCVNLAIHTLLPVRPDLVVSGINAGFNIGLGFVLSSGTVGACIEANLANIPAIAVSQAFDVETRNQYAADYSIAPDHLTRFRSQTDQILNRVFEIFLSEQNKQQVLSSPVTWNVNMPFRAVGGAGVTLAPLGKTRYGKCFQEQSQLPGSAVRVFKHAGLAEVRDSDPHCDSSVISVGVPSISLIDVWGLTGDRGHPELSGVVERFRAGE
jgi:5'/3'-nucleotidase SurE